MKKRLWIAVGLGLVVLIILLTRKEETGVEDLGANQIQFGVNEKYTLTGDEQVINVSAELESVYEDFEAKGLNAAINRVVNGEGRTTFICFIVGQGLDEIEQFYLSDKRYENTQVDKNIADSELLINFDSNGKNVCIFAKTNKTFNTTFSILFVPNNASSTSICGNSGAIKKKIGYE